MVNGIGVRYDVRGLRNQAQLPGKEEWTDITDGVAAKIRETLATVPFPIRNRDGFIEDAGGILQTNTQHFHELMVNACAFNAADPLIEYFDDLPRWDGLPRLGAWLFHCFDVADESLELSEWAGTFVFLGSVWRAKQPGVKLVLQSQIKNG